MHARELSQEVKDALADAETLRWNADRLTGNYLGLAAYFVESRERAEWWIDGPEASRQHGQTSARAAFRAVPGLREE